MCGRGVGYLCVCLHWLQQKQLTRAHTHTHTTRHSSVAKQQNEQQQQRQRRQRQKKNVTSGASSTAHWLRTSETARGAAQASVNGNAKQTKIKRQSGQRERTGRERERATSASKRASAVFVKRRGSTACWGNAEHAGNETARSVCKRGNHSRARESNQQRERSRQRERVQESHAAARGESARVVIVVVLQTNLHTHTETATACANFAGKRWQRSPAPATSNLTWCESLEMSRAGMQVFVFVFVAVRGIFLANKFIPLCNC